ncbi:MAG TPA: OmpA family protein [Puia sp.]|nr:OmpA family protein [Puia sp.]
MANQENVHKSWDTALWFSLATILVTFIIIKGCSSDTTPTALVESPNTETIASAGTTPESIKVRLPDGTELDAYKGGIEDKLVAYLNSTAATDSISKSRWFDFDNLNFKTGSAEITEASMKQVGNISAILKAYPRVSIKIGGYTDKTGNEPDNQKLSQQRAEAVVEALKKAGASPGTQLVGAEGYGSQYARAAADAPDEERRLDRRISINVRSK